MRVAALIVYLFLAQGVSFSQSAKNYTPYRNYPGKKISHIAENLKQMDERAKATHFEKHAAKKMFAESIDEMKEYLIDADTSGQLMHADTLTRFLEKILARIVSKNPELARQHPIICVDRRNEMNAANHGAGIIIINIEMIARLDNEDQLAFVICHELGHDFLDHVIGGIKKRMEIFASKEFKKRYNKAASQAYNSYRSAQKIYLSYLSKYMEHSRENEREADSLGLLFLAGAGYNAREAVTQMIKLDSADELMYRKDLDLEKIFSSGGFPFNDAWLIPDTGGSWGSNLKERLFPDSLKTHPDCKQRVQALRKIIRRKGFDTLKAVEKNGYDFYKRIAKLEGLEIYMEDEEYGMALYNVLNIMKEEPENEYLKKVEIECLYEIGLAKEKHYFSRIVDFPSSNYNSAYNKFLILFNNINSSSTNSLTKYTYDEYSKSFEKDIQTAYVKALISAWAADKKSKAQISKTFLKEYNDRHYYTLLFSKFNSKTD